MTRADELLALAQACEKAVGPSVEERQLVIDAFFAVDPHELALPPERRGDADQRYQRTMRHARFYAAINATYERASLDAAVMMVPEGYRWCIPGFVRPEWDARIVDANGLVVQPLSQPCATPALALCAAALRALSAIETGAAA